MQTLNGSASNTRNRLTRLCTVIFCFALLAFFLDSRAVQAQSTTQPPPPAQAADATGQPAPQNTTAEITSRDEATTFKVNVNLVLVRVVVRDSKEHAVGNLQKDNFQLFDNRKPQVITQFSAEQRGTQVATVHEAPKSNAGETPAESVTPPAVPERYIAYLFDDVHLNFGDLMQVRNAADRHMAKLQPTDRAAIFSTSGQTMLDFTDDRAKLHDALLHLQSRPIASGFANPCFNVTYYMADLIQNKNDPQALQVATQDALFCLFGGEALFLQAAQHAAEAAAMQKLNEGDAESHVSLTVLSDAIRKLTVMPGQRSMVLVSPGFLTPHLEFEYTNVIDRAVRAQVTIGTLDARGLYVVGPEADVSSRGAPGASVQGFKQQYAIQEASANSDILAILADATGGSFFHNSNDLDEGFRRVASTPEYSYVLGFSPQNLKLDGSFHSLQVKLKSAEKLSVQARRGYFAPKHAADPSQEAKQEIEDALFSQEEVHTLPVHLHTQFYKSSTLDAKLTVLAQIDVRRLRLRKADGRNNDELTVVSALFNGNGTLVQGIQKTLTLRLKDETLEKKMGSGVTLKTSFDVKPGSYLVRLVVRDAEAQLVSAESDAVRIP
jgi:VWFA-related protein